MREYSWVQIQLKKPVGYLLRSKLQDMNKPRFYRNKPIKFNRELFDVIPVYEVIAD